MDEQTTEQKKAYNKQARRAGYLRWKDRQEGKSLSDDERAELTAYEASVAGGDEE